MTTTQNMLAPGSIAGLIFTSVTGTSYTSGANGLISNVAAADVNSLESAGCTQINILPLTTLALSTAAGVYVQEGQVNLIPVSTIAAVANIAVPTKLGSKTSLVSLATGNFVITASAVTLLDQLGAAKTVLTCNTGTVELVCTGSTTLQMVARSIISSASASVTYGIACS